MVKVFVEIIFLRYLGKCSNIGLELVRNNWFFGDFNRKEMEF